jgi:hypothetical protein
MAWLPDASVVADPARSAIARCAGGGIIRSSIATTLYALSDGGWFDTRTGVQKIRWLAEQGVPTIHISIGTAPLSVEADRITVISDPADALTVIADDTVAALRAGARQRAA